MFLGYKLKQLRKEKGLTMVELEKMSGIKQAMLSQIESGKKNPRPATVEKLANALGVNREYFYIESVDIPAEIYSNYSEEVKEFIASEENLPYLLLASKIKESGIPLQLIVNLIETWEKK